jgi:hypothetical protein
VLEEEHHVESTTGRDVIRGGVTMDSVMRQVGKLSRRRDSRIPAVAPQAQSRGLNR